MSLRTLQKAIRAVIIAQYDEIHLVGCCTDLCVFNFSIIAQKNLEYKMDSKTIKHMPKIIVHRELVDAYDGLIIRQKKSMRYFLTAST